MAHKNTIHLFFTFLSLGLAWTMGFSANAQHFKTLNDTLSLYDGTRAIEQTKIQIFSGDSIVKSGAYSIQSEKIPGVPQENYTLVFVNGNYAGDMRSGMWDFRRQTMELKVTALKNYTASTVLNGIETAMKGNFQANMLEGNWTLKQRYIENSRLMREHATLITRFKKNVATGAFKYSHTEEKNPVQVKGQFDPQGNLTGIWELKYRKGDTEILERREYQEGFLLSLKKDDVKRDSVLNDIAYSDVVVTYRATQDTVTSGKSMVKGEKPFGLLFNNGYRADDPKRTSQYDGNEVLKNVLDQFIGEESLIRYLKDSVEIAIAHTRRFKFVYDEGEDSLIAEVQVKIRRQQEIADSLRDDSSLKINRISNDSIAFFYDFLPHYLKRLNKVDSLLTQLSSGRFDYEFRDNYFESGLPFTCQKDTVHYTFNDKKVQRPIPEFHCISGPRRLVKEINTYADQLISWKEAYLAALSPILRLYAKIDRINEYDRQIIMLKDSMELLYLGATIAELSDTLLAQRIEEMGEVEKDLFERFGLNDMKVRLKAYASEEDPNEKLKQGSNMVALLNEMIQMHVILQDINGMKERLDRAFTRFSPNPFFPRDIESRIKQHIYSRGAEILLPYYLREIRRSSDLMEISEKVDNLYALENRMKELAEREDEEVIRLNSRMRRESQPERIKRLLGL